MRKLLVAAFLFVGALSFLPEAAFSRSATQEALQSSEFSSITYRRARVTTRRAYRRGARRAYYRGAYYGGYYRPYTYGHARRVTRRAYRRAYRRGW